MIIDTHTHLDSDAFDDLDEVIKRANSNNIEKFIIPGTNKKCLSNALSIVKKYENMYFALGFHPYDIDEYDSDIFDKNINNKKCIAIGECGLDYYRGDDNKKEQNDVFLSHINIAKKYNKPLIIHIRDAKDNFSASLDAKKLLIENNASKVSGVLHCFNANEDLLELAEHNFYFGIGGILTFKNAKDLQDILPKIPLDKLLLETDAPYLAPHPNRGKRNEPSFIPYVLKKMSEILCIEEQKLQSIILDNTNRLFTF